ncbi:MAG: serine/threonine-protein kinase [Acidobacteriota bacterium]
MDNSSESAPRGRLRALYDWLTGTPAPLPPGDPAIARMRTGAPTRIAHYVIARKLGEGGMGVVYAARDERLERIVAVKTMSALSTLASDDTARKRFWREARAAASVNHPNICQIYEIGEDDGQLFIAMELLEGEARSERLRRGPLSVSHAVPIGLGILAALSALHGRGIVHRDLKPSNVFLTPHGVKLLDFGLARPQPEPAISWWHSAKPAANGFSAGSHRSLCKDASSHVASDLVGLRNNPAEAGSHVLRRTWRPTSVRPRSDQSGRSRTSRTAGTISYGRGVTDTLVSVTVVAAEALWLVAASPT